MLGWFSVLNSVKKTVSEQVFEDDGRRTMTGKRQYKLRWDFVTVSEKDFTTTIRTRISSVYSKAARTMFIKP